MLHILISSLVIGYAVSVKAAFLPPGGCGGGCPSDQCCIENTFVVSKKRFASGTCIPYQQEGQSCDYGCGCDPALYCELLLQASRAVEVEAPPSEDPGSTGGLQALLPPTGICRTKPTRLQLCVDTSDCLPDHCCNTAFGVCQSYQQNGQPC